MNINFLHFDNSIKILSVKNTPTISINSGDVIRLSTKSPTISYGDLVDKPFKRELCITGPINITDCHINDIISVEILNIQLEEKGKMWTSNLLGILKEMNVNLYIKELPIIDNYAVFSNTIRLPIQPMIGTIGVTPSDIEVDCLVPGLYGGNMDVPSITVGSVVNLVAQVDGGLLALGDVHATMGLARVSQLT